jgi:hypothetical protein
MNDCSRSGLNTSVARPLFSLGHVVATPGALSMLEFNCVDPHHLAKRHQCADWGNVSAEDACSNVKAVTEGARILSSYSMPNGARIWVITEADRSATTLLLPEEY